MKYPNSFSLQSCDWRLATQHRHWDAVWKREILRQSIAWLKYEGYDKRKSRLSTKGFHSCTRFIMYFSLVWRSISESLHNKNGISKPPLVMRIWTTQKRSVCAIGAMKCVRSIVQKQRNIDSYIPQLRLTSAIPYFRPRPKTALRVIDLLIFIFSSTSNHLVLILSKYLQQYRNKATADVYRLNCLNPQHSISMDVWRDVPCSKRSTFSSLFFCIDHIIVPFSYNLITLSVSKRELYAPVCVSQFPIFYFKTFSVDRLGRNSSPSRVFALVTKKCQSNDKPFMSLYIEFQECWNGCEK